MGETSVRESLKTPTAFGAYILIVLGGSTIFSAASWTTPAAALSSMSILLGIALLVHLRRGAAQAFHNFCETARGTDMRDITAYYRISPDGEASLVRHVT